MSTASSSPNPQLLPLRIHSFLLAESTAFPSPNPLLLPICIRCFFLSESTVSPLSEIRLKSDPIKSAQRYNNPNRIAKKHTTKLLFPSLLSPFIPVAPCLSPLLPVVPRLILIYFLLAAFCSSHPLSCISPDNTIPLPHISCGLKRYIHDRYTLDTR